MRNNVYIIEQSYMRFNIIKLFFQFRFRFWFYVFNYTILCQITDFMNTGFQKFNFCIYKRIDSKQLLQDGKLPFVTGKIHCNQINVNVPKFNLLYLYYLIEHYRFIIYTFFQSKKRPCYDVVIYSTRSYKCFV